MKKQYLFNVYHMIIDGLSDSIPIILSFMIISFKAGEKEAGVIISLSSLVNTMLGLTSLYFSRRLGLLRSLSLVIFLYGMGYATNAFARDIYLAGSCFVLGNAGFSIFHNIAFSYLTSNSERQSLGKALGDFTAIGDIGRIPLASLAGFFAALTIAGFSGWRIVCLTYGLGALLLAGYLFCSSLFIKKEETGLENISVTIPQKRFPSFSILRNYQYILPMSASLLDAVGSDQIFVFLPFLLFAKGIDPKIIGTFALAFTFGCLLGKTLLGRMVDQFGTRKIFIISELIMAVLLAILILSRRLWIIVGASLLLGIVTKGTVPAVQTIITEPVREKHEYDDVFAINSFFRGVAHVVTPLIFGFIASAVNIHWSFAFMAIAAAGAVIPVLLMKTECSEEAFIQ